MTTKPAWSGTSTAVLPSAAHQASARSRVSSLIPSGKQTSTSCIRGTGLKTWSPKRRPGIPAAAAISATLSEEVVVARSAFGQAAATAASTSPFGPVSSITDSTTTSQSARSAGSVVTRSREGSAPSILAQAATAFSSARQADASLRASRIVSAVVVETAARPVAIAPLPAIPGASYPCFPFIRSGFLSHGPLSGLG